MLARLLVLLILEVLASSIALPAKAQSPDRFHPDLRARLLVAPDDDDEFIPVIFHTAPELQLTQAERFVELAKADDGLPPKERRADGRAKLISALKTRSGQNVAGILNTLVAGQNQAQPVVKRVRELWILGAVSCEATRGFLEGLQDGDMNNTPGAGVRLDLRRRAGGGVATSPKVANPIDVPWGLTKIGVDLTPPEVDPLSDVLVAVIDGGFNIDHPDLASVLWTNPFEVDGDLDPLTGELVDTDGNGHVDDMHGWNFEDDSPDVQTLTNAHGSAVCGIIAGTGAEGIRTGVAMNARLMLLAVGDAANETNEAQVWAAMQYALENGAAIVNASLNWAEDHAPHYESWRKGVDVLTEAGVLFVTIPGNDGDHRLIPGGGFLSPPSSVTTPGRVPSALTVGASDDTDQLWFSETIYRGEVYYEGSNTGPVTWQDVPTYWDYPFEPGLTKPNVVAPGVNIQSTLSNADPYASGLKGTSFAAPYVTGLAALLAGQNPGYGPYELRYVIEESALPLYPAGLSPPLSPNNHFGWGRIRVAKAMGESIDPADHDLQITATSDEWTTEDIWIDNDCDGTEDTPIANQENKLFARVRNTGGGAVGNVQLHFYYADLATTGSTDFDPNADGDPEDGSFTYIGTYQVPVLGPAGSDHETAIGVVAWEIEVPTGDHWCVGVSAMAPPPNAPEVDTSNNLAFRNFFDLVISTSGSFGFGIEPTPESRRDRNAEFALEIKRIGLPEDATVLLSVDREWKELSPDPDGARLISRPEEERRDEETGALFDILANRALFRGLKSPKGGPLPAHLMVRLPPEAVRSPNARIVLSTLDSQGERHGGLTVRIVEAKPHSRGGPHRRRNR